MKHSIFLHNWFKKNKPFNVDTSFEKSSPSVVLTAVACTMPLRSSFAFLVFVSRIVDTASIPELSLDDVAILSF